ncbi:MAG: DUF1553 domain-containing protein [Acidobacteria bacterium]|nr:DUF1553 domain-containing protein [Acidobacteriota bacterium]
MLACAESIPEIAAIPPARRTRAQQLKLRLGWIANAAPASVRARHRELATLQAERRRLESQFPTVMVMQELPQPRPTYLLRRGAYDMPGEQVTRGLPVALTSGKPGPPPANRLELARWIVGRENPLTARVTVNRLWQMLFGSGIVRTVEDFGLQGELPTHPELLDWLALEFVEGGTGKSDRGRGWSVKQLLRRIVTSATYRQSSIRTPLAGDPENRLLARGSRLRLPGARRLRAPGRKDRRPVGQTIPAT